MNIFKGNYYNDIITAMDNYNKKYHTHTRVVALHIVLWNILYILFGDHLADRNATTINEGDEEGTHNIFEIEQKEREKKLRKIYDSDDSIVVLRGPFAGMKYPDYISTGSSLWPKLLGVYEKEIAPIIEKTLQEKYKYIIDVGCAEGYYSVGWATRNVADHIIAYDVDENARKLCQNMCIENKVSIEIKEFCSPDELNSYDFSGKKSLLMVDCEGYERTLFNSDNISNLVNVDILVEIHDWCQYEMKTLDYLKKLFADTHTIEIVYGVDDYEKAYMYKVPELEGWNILDRYEVLREGRRRLGTWLWLRVK